MKSSKSYLAWVGQNATTGQPHPITGNYSMYGWLHWFPTKKERDEFVDNFYNHNNPSEYAVATNKKEAKAKYFAGMTQVVYDEYVEHCESLYECYKVFDKEQL